MLTTMLRFPAALVAAACTLTLACVTSSEREPGEDCSVASPANIDELPQRELTIGEAVTGSVDGVSFVPWLEGDMVTYVWGPQGLPMITPWLELPVAPGESAQEEACWHVTLEHLDQDGQPSTELAEGYVGGLVFERVDGAMRAGPIWDVLSSPQPTLPLATRATVVGPDFVAQAEVEIELAQP